MTSISGQDRSTLVWLPLSFPGKNVKTEFTPLAKDQIEKLAASYGGRPEELVCPEPLGIREVYAWRLADDVARGGGRALEDFGLLIEGLLYGLIRTETFDLAGYDLQFDRPEDRYLTVLRYHSAPDSSPTTAGSFSPDTLVCPAGNWSQRKLLADDVSEYRFHLGQRARGLLRPYLDCFPSPETLWYKALQWLINQYPTSTDEGPGSQSNAGPLFLRLNPGTAPTPVFFPTFRPGYLDLVSRCFTAETQLPSKESISLQRQDRVLAQLNLPLQRGNPKMFGLGSLTILDAVAQNLPVRAGLSGDQEIRYIAAIDPVVNVYQRELALSNNRFLIPDSLRCAWHLWGDMAPQRLLKNQNSIYGELSLRARLNPKPDQLSNRPGLYKDSEHTFFVTPLSGGRLAYHVERQGGQFIGELSALGYALWRVFCGLEWDESAGRAEQGGAIFVELRDGRLGSPATLQPAAPNRDRELTKWETLLALTEELPQESLFRAASFAYADRFGISGARAKNRVPSRPVSIGGVAWWTTG